MKQASGVKLLIPFFLSLFLIAAAPTLTGRVVGVSDGDTITILVDKEQYKIRLHGVDCPEKRQAYGTKAKLFTPDVAYKKLWREHAAKFYGGKEKVTSSHLNLFFDHIFSFKNRNRDGR